MPGVYLALGNTEAASRYLARWAEQGYSLSSTSTHPVTHRTHRTRRTR
jgi:hypothetical protein